MNREQRRRQRKAAAAKKPSKPTQAEAINLAWEVYTLIALSVLHDKYGFGKRRLADFHSRVSSLMESITGNFVSIEDLNNTLHEETGVLVIDKNRYRKKVKR